MTDERINLLGRRESLLARLRNIAKEVPGVDPTRRLQLTLAMDRFLARLLETTPWGSWVLKGGYANQLRAPLEARFTQDVDLKIDAPLSEAHHILRIAAAVDLDDLFSYELVGESQQLDGPPGGGLRFRIRANLAGIEFAQFGADINSKDAVIGELERHRSDPFVVKLGFASSEFPVYPRAQQFAEKLHAYTRPRSMENTRAKDLADMIWFIERYTFSTDDLIDSAVATFGRRSSHPWPPIIPNPPASWAQPYTALRNELKIDPATTEAAKDVLLAFLEPVLAEQRGIVTQPIKPRN